MARAKSKKIKDLMRKQEYERQQALLRQQQATRDFIITHCMIARKNSKYPVTEKVLTGNPEDLKALLSLDLTDPKQIIINPDDYPEGLVIPEMFFDITFLR